jgi:vancomycin aglycone glucosyltransferase
MGRAGTSNRWWDSRCSCGHSARRRGCAPPDFAELLARVGVPLVPIGQPVRLPVTGPPPPAAADLPRRAAELVAAQFDTVPAAAEGCDALVATGVIPAGVWL